MKKFLTVIVALIILATATVLAAPPLFDTPYIGNSYRKTFHYRECDSVYEMWAEHQVPFKSRDEAINAGYRPCGNCRP